MTTSDKMVLDALRRVKAGESTFDDAVILSIIGVLSLKLTGQEQRAQEVMDALFPPHESRAFCSAALQFLAADGHGVQDAAGAECKH